MKVSKDLPPNYLEIVAAIPSVQSKDFSPIFCFGDTVYGVKDKLRKDLEIHEGVHSKQQDNDPMTWWRKYLNETSFRLSQEIEAYAAQYSFISLYFKGRLLKQSLDSMAKDLSSALYGNLLTHGEAVSKIRNAAKDQNEQEKKTS